MRGTKITYVARSSAAQGATYWQHYVRSDK